MTERTRTFQWDDPSPSALAAREMSGLDYILAIKNGELPAAPIAAALDFVIEVVEAGRVVFVGEPAEYHYNPIGTVHGGYIATLCDSAMACAIHTTLPQGTGYTTLELKVNYVRPLTVETGKVFCEGKVIHTGRRVATAEGRVTDANGKLYGHATTTCAVFS